MSTRSPHFLRLTAYYVQQRELGSGSRLSQTKTRSRGADVYLLSLPDHSIGKVALRGAQTCWFEVDVPGIGVTRVYPDNTLIPTINQEVEKHLNANGL